MKTLKYFLIASVLFIIASCGNSEQAKEKGEEVRKQSLIQIKKLEDEMHKSKILNNSTAGLSIKAYSDFVALFPDDSLCPDFLFKAGEIATATQQYPQALNYYKTITDKYPNYKLVQESLYLQGVLLDNYLNDDAKAKTIYEQVIAKYPTSTYANDSKAAINNLGKTDEQLIEEFKKKNGEK
jgi:outer membrane protein assembly factor BamD (BamD/ComL family)